MTDKQYKERRFVMFGDMGNIKQYVLDKKDNERFNSKWALMDKLNELAEENEQLKISLKDKESLIDICEKKFKELGYLITCDDDGYVIE